MDIERRAFPLEFRAAQDTGNTIIGHAAVFNTITDLGPFKERIAPGAFTETIQNDDIRALFNHDPNIVLGRNKAGTLKLSEDDKGLAVEIDLPDTSYANDLKVSIQRGDINQMSFAFMVLEDSWDLVDGEEVRTLLKVQLFDVSLVTYPAYPQTDASIRSVYENHCKQRGINRDAIKPEQEQQGLNHGQVPIDILRLKLNLISK